MKKNQKPSQIPRLSARIKGLPSEETEAGPSVATSPGKETRENNNKKGQESDGDDSKNITYPNIYNDHDPLPEKASKEVIEAYNKKADTYMRGVFEILTSTNVRGESLWLDFITAFRPHTIKAWDFKTLIMWTELLISRDIFVEKGRRIKKGQAIIDVLYRDSYVSVMTTETEKPIKDQYMYVHPDRLQLVNEVK